MPYDAIHDLTDDDVHDTNAPMPPLLPFLNINLSNFNKNILTNRFELHIMSPKNREILETVEVEFRK